MSQDENKPILRDEDGRFLPGTRRGPGNPYLGEMARFRGELYRSVREQDVHDVALKIIEQAKNGCTKSQHMFLQMLGLLVNKIEADVTSREISPEEGQRRVAAFFGMTSLLK